METPLRPAFRRLDIHRVDEGDERGLVLIDPLGVVEDQVFVPEGLMPALGLLDGVRTTAHIQAELEAKFGDEVPAGYVDDLIKQLDERLLLWSPRFEAALAGAATDFQSQSLRPAKHAGSAGYPAETEPLREALSSMIRTAEAPERASPRGIVAPHIDLARGREGYAQAYGYLAECEPADLYVVFGTGHQGPSSVVTGLPLDWDTPLGAVPTSRAFVEAIHGRLGSPQPLDVLLHRGEHSIEFQVLFLKHLLGDRPFEIAGFLTGALPSEDADLQRVLTAFREETAACGKTVCYVAGADLAHLGPFFGDKEEVSPERLDRLALDEKERLANLERGDTTGFYKSVEGNGNPDRICGTTPMVLTASLAGGGGELLYYGQAAAPDSSQVVSYCAMAFDGS